ncbi:ABC transporter ATP-binding protein [Micromonospora sp. NPDC049559]|uniref:ABC transporter ATP-binding protein n=1 Tax=Micromonospora sp. NPDC049559 TaxID=3155923 RepID=UPI00341E7050
MDPTGGGDRPLLRAVRYAGGWVPALAALAVAGAAAELLLPAALGLAVDAALAGGGTWWPLAAAGLVAVVAATDTLGALAGGHADARATARLRHRLVRHLFALDPRAAGRWPVGDLVGRLVAQAADAGQAGTAAVLGVAALLPPIGGTVALLLLEPLLGAVFLAGLALLGLLMRAFVADASAAVAGYQRCLGSMAGRLLESLGGARSVAAAGTVAAERARVLDALPELHRHGLATWRALARATARNATVAPLLPVAVLAVGGWSVSAGWLTPGELFAATRYAALGAGLGAVLSTVNRLVRTRAGARRAAEVLAEPVRTYGSEPLPAGPGAVTLRGVTVYRDDATGPDAGPPILDRIDLHLPAGASTAVVGASGAGKSTLAAVAGRLRDPDAGEVLLDGVPLRRLDRAALRAAVGYGFERPVLVGDTVADAIGLGGARPALAEIRRAARAAAVDGVVERLPGRWHTPLAQAPMSGGEAQRIGLARALHARRLLVLDDATSSLDTVTERRITRALAGPADGRTRLIVTHRAGTAAAADRVAWLDGGRLRAVGRHADLWADPAYRAVFQPPAEERAAARSTAVPAGRSG